MSASVATPSSEQSAALLSIEMVRTLMGGTAAMRAAGTRYLPQEPAEPVDAYRNRLQRSTLFNALGKTVADMTGKVFKKPIVLGDDVPGQIRQYTENIDAAGRHLNVFARDLFADGLQTGITFILVDMPQKVERPDGRPATLADEQRSGNRPYLVHIRVEDLIGWKSAWIGGSETLTQVRIRECVTEQDGEFGEKEVEQVRLLEPGKWTTYRKTRLGDGLEAWTIHESGTTSVEKITLVPVYISRIAFMRGAPPLGKLAELNVAFWQSASDQRNILHVARVPILFGSGWTADDQIVVGAGNLIRNSNPEAKLQYVEHSGAAIGAGRDELLDLQFQMQTQGLQLLIPQPGGKTATGEIRDDAKENSPLAMMATALQDAIEQALGFMAEYVGLGEDVGGEVVVNTDFGVSLGGQDLQPLLDAVNSGQISKKTFWAEWKRRGVLGDGFDPEIEADRLASEAPALSMNLG